MNFLIIGGNGFIGSHLIDVLIENNHNVRVYDLFMEKYKMSIRLGRRRLRPNYL